MVKFAKGKWRSYNKIKLPSFYQPLTTSKLYLAQLYGENAPRSEWIKSWFPWLSLTEFFKSLLLSFSPNLDEFNPDIPEWRQDVGRVIKKALLQVSDFHFLCPFCSLLLVFSNCSVSLYISYFHSYTALSQLFPALLLPLPPSIPTTTHTHTHTLGSLVRQKRSLRPNLRFFIR